MQIGAVVLHFIWELILCNDEYGRLLIHFSNWFHQDPLIRPLAEQDSNSLQQMIPEIPLWVKNPDYDRVCILTLMLISKCV